MAKDHLTIDLFGDKPERPAKPKRTAKKSRRARRGPMVSKDGKVTLYFIQQGEDGPIKIGRTRSQESLRSRIRTLRNGSPYDLKLLGSCRCEPWVEIGLHHLLVKSRLNGEWFAPKYAILVIAAASNDGYDAMLKAAADVLSYRDLKRGWSKGPTPAWAMLLCKCNR